MRERFIRRLVATMKCAVCGRRYTASNINVLGHKDEMWFLSVSCPACNTYGLVAAVIKGDKEPAFVTDLTEAEYAKFKSSEHIHADDVLDIHNVLKDFDGDFIKLFS